MNEFYNPVKAIFGPGSFDKLPELIADRVYAIVTYDEEFSMQLVRRLEDAGRSAAIIINNVKANPDFPEIEAGCEALKNLPNLPEVFVGLGGGSAIDTAKALAVSGGDWMLLKEHLITGGGRADELKKPCVIAVPTNAGTGSEMSLGAVIWDRANGGKWGVRSNYGFPDYAIVDPELTLTLPRDQTISTGLDALSHALESIWQTKRNFITQPIAEQAARDVIRCLPLLVDDLTNLDLRKTMSAAAMKAGVALSQTRTSIAHQLSYGLSLNYGVPHGIACGFSLPMVMSWSIGFDRNCDVSLKTIFGDNLDTGVRDFEEFFDRLGVSRNPTTYGPSKSEWDKMVMNAASGIKGQNFLGNPKSS